MVSMAGGINCRSGQNMEKATQCCISTVLSLRVRTRIGTATNSGWNRISRDAGLTCEQTHQSAVSGKCCGFDLKLLAQPHMPLESRPPLQTHTPLENAAA